MATFQLFLSVQGRGGSPTGPAPVNRVGDQDIGSPGRPVSCGLQVAGEPGIVVQEQHPLGDEGEWVHQNTTVLGSYFYWLDDDDMFRPCLAIFRS